MDAHQKNPRISRLVDRLSVIALAALAVAGLWQCYGEWLVATVKSRVG